MRYHFTFFLLIFISTANAQQSFYLQYHPFPSQQAVCLKEAIGGGYILGSNFTNSFGDKGILITRFDSALNIIWEKAIDQTGITERMYSFTQDNNGDFFIVGTSDNNSLLIRTDSSVSNFKWNKIFQHTPHSTMDKILCYSSNSYYTMGHAENSLSQTLDSLVIMSFDSMSNVLWTRSFSTGGTHGVEFTTNISGDLITGIQLGGVIRKGGCISFNPANGNLQWNNYWNLDAMSTTPGGTMEALTLSHNNGFMLYGIKFTGSNGDVRNYILNCSSTGNLISWMEYNFNYWSMYLNLLNNITAIKSDQNSYTMAGYISPYQKLVLMKVDSNLTVSWCRSYEILNISSTPLSLIQTADDGYLIAGTINNNKIFLTKMDSLGHTDCGDSTYTVTSQTTTDVQYSYTATQTSVFTSTGYLPLVSSVNFQNTVDTICSSINTATNFNLEKTVAIFPNPGVSTLTVTSSFPLTSIVIFSLIGQIHRIGIAESKSININIEQFPTGIYFLRAETDQGTITTKFIKE